MKPTGLMRLANGITYSIIPITLLLMLTGRVGALCWVPLIGLVMFELVRSFMSTDEKIRMYLTDFRFISIMPGEDIARTYDNVDYEGKSYIMEYLESELATRGLSDRTKIIDGLWIIGNKTAIKILISRFHSDPYAQEKLREVGNYDTSKSKRELVVGLLLETLEDKNEVEEVEKLGRLLLKIGIKDATVSTKPMEDWLIETVNIEHEDWMVQDDKCKVLGEIGGDKARDALLMVLDATKSHVIGETVVDALIEFNPEFALDPRAVEVKEESWRVWKGIQERKEKEKKWILVKKCRFCSRDGSRCWKCGEHVCMWHGCKCFQHSD